MARPRDPDLAAQAYYLSKEEHRSLREIAEELGVSKTTAANLVRDAEEQEPFLDLLDRAVGRRDQAHRLKAYIAIILDEVRGGRADPLKAIAGLAWIENRWAKLAGLDAPAEIHVSGDNAGVQPNVDILLALRAYEDRRADPDEP